MNINRYYTNPLGKGEKLLSKLHLIYNYYNINIT